MEVRTTLEPGSIVDAYRIQRVVGAGGFGITYEAVDVHLGTSIALKEYFPWDFAQRTDTLEVRPTSEKHQQAFGWGMSSFLQEARTLATLRHPSIVRVYRVFELNATAYMVMEYEQGPSFEAWLKELGRVPTQAELDRIAAPLLDALHVMHTGGFLHRDIAPDNIIVRPDMSPVLLDFGAARKTIASKTHVLTGLVKQGYSPQEQYTMEGKFQGPWTDLYALGGTLYRALTGLPPTEAPERALEDRLARLAASGLSGYRSEFLDAIDACLKVRPGDRPQSVTELRQRLFADGGKRIERIQVAASPATAAIDRSRTRLVDAPAVATTAADAVGEVDAAPSTRGTRIPFALQFGLFFLVLIVAVGGFTIAAIHATNSIPMLIILVFVFVLGIAWLETQKNKRARKGES